MISAAESAGPGGVVGPVGDVGAGVGGAVGGSEGVDEGAGLVGIGTSAGPGVGDASSTLAQLRVRIATRAQAAPTRIEPSLFISPPSKPTL